MACFLVPATEAAITTIIEKVLESDNRSAKATKLPANSATAHTAHGAAAHATENATDIHTAADLSASATVATATAAHTVAGATAAHMDHSAAAGATDMPANDSVRNRIARKLRWLNIMLWVGAGLSCVEHIWHGEVVPYPPFLTALSTPITRAEMLHEMSTEGVLIAAGITALWAGVVAISVIIEKKKNPAVSQREGRE